MRFSSGSELLILVESVVVSAFLTGCGGGGGGGGHAPRPINGDTQALHGSEGGSDVAFNAVGDGAVYMQRYEADPTVWDIFSALGF